MGADGTGEATLAGIGGDLFSRGHDGEQFHLQGRLGHGDFDDLLEWTRSRKASDVTIASDNPVRAEIGGEQVRVTRKRITHPELSEIVRGIYGDNGPGILNAGVPLDFAYDVKRDFGRMRFRVNATCIGQQGHRGFSLTIRNLPSVPIELSKLGLEPEITENLRPPQGMNLFTGPTGSGKSTLLSSLVRWRCEQKGANEKIVEFSKPIEYIYSGLEFPDSHVEQSEPGNHLRPSDEDKEHYGSIWAFAVANALRRAPKIVVIGEARDRQTIEASIEAALTGHLLMSTMHTIGVPETIGRALMTFPDEARRSIAVDLLECMNLVVTQLLLPRVGGGKVGCREFMLFDRKVRAALYGLEADRWAGRIRELLTARQVTGRSMADSARALLDAREISAETYEWVAARSSGESKVVRKALGAGLYDIQEG